MRDNWIDDIDEDREVTYEDLIDKLYNKDVHFVSKVFRVKHWREPYSEDELDNYILTGEYEHDKRYVKELQKENTKLNIKGVNMRCTLVSEFDEKLFETYNGDIDRIGDYRGVSEYVVCKCNKCGNIFAEIGTRLLDRKRVCCMEKIVSKGEELIKNLLIQNNLKFSSQDSDGCINPLTGRKLLYDFVVEHKGKRFYLEIQGQQHYEPVEYFGGKEDFENVIYRDSVKRKYAEINGIFIELDYREGNLNLLKKRFNRKFIKEYIDKKERENK